MLGLVSSALAFLALDVAAGNAPHLVRDLAGRGVVGADKLVDSGIVAIRGQTVVQIVIKLLQAIGLAILIRFILRGSPGARIAVYVLAGLVTFGSVAVTVLFTVRDTRLRQQGTSEGRVWLTEQDLLPGWHQAMTYTGLALSVVIAVAVVWLLTRPSADAHFRRGAPDRPAEEKAPLRRRLAGRWGIIVATALSVPSIVIAFTGQWLWIVHVIAPIDAIERSYDAGDVGFAALAFAAGVLLLALLVATAVVLTGRAATAVAFCALGVTVALAVDLLLVAFMAAEFRTLAAGHAISLQHAHPNASWVKFHVGAPGVTNGMIALILLDAAAAQIPRRDLGPRIQAAIGTALVVFALALPWATGYSTGQPRTSRYWLWSLGGPGLLVGVGALTLVLLAVIAMLKPRVQRVPRVELVLTALMVSIAALRTLWRGRKRPSVKQPTITTTPINWPNAVHADGRDGPSRRS